eukprot:10012107-Ditylum_brightwellii.AAC.1
MQRLVIPSELNFQSNFGVTSGKGLGVYSLNNQPKKPEKGLFLDAAIGGGRDTKDCGDFFMMEKGWFVGNQQ